MTLTPDYGLSYQRAQRHKRRFVRKALHFVNGLRAVFTAAGFVDVAHPVDPFPPLDPNTLVVAFRQGLLGGDKVEFADKGGETRVQRHDASVRYAPSKHRSVSDILDDAEAMADLIRNSGMGRYSLFAWRRTRAMYGRGKHFNDTVRA
jgi:hypothetical protein